MERGHAVKQGAVADHLYFFLSSRRRHTRSTRDWSSDVCSSDLQARSTLPGSGDRQRSISGTTRWLHRTDVVPATDYHNFQIDSIPPAFPVISSRSDA